MGNIEEGRLPNFQTSRLLDFQTAPDYKKLSQEKSRSPEVQKTRSLGVSGYTLSFSLTIFFYENLKFTALDCQWFSTKNIPIYQKGFLSTTTTNQVTLLLSPPVWTTSEQAYFEVLKIQIYDFFLIMQLYKFICFWGIRQYIFLKDPILD